MIHFNAKATLINDTDNNCHITAVELVKPINYMGFMSRHITPLVINSLGGGHTQTHTYTYTHTHKHTDVLTETILRNLAHAGCKTRYVL